MTVQIVSRRERKKQAVREKIQDELVRLINTKGLDRTTIDDLCEAADIARKTFYNYYSTRHDLIIEVCQNRLFNRLENNIALAMQSRKGLSAQLGFIITEMEQFIIHARSFERELINYMLANLTSSNSSEQAHFMQESYEHMFKAGIDELKPELTPTFCADMTVAMISAMSLSLLGESADEVKVRTAMLLSYIRSSMLK